MKILKTTLIILAAVISASCSSLKEDLSECPPPYNTTLRLHYAGDPETPAEFGDTIDCITLFFFDEGGQLVKTEKVLKNDFESENIINLLLPVGQYTVAGWANAMTYTKFTGSTIDDYKLINPCRETNGDNALDTDDPLYFGSVDINVIENQKISEDIYFKGAHIDIEIYFKGFGMTNDPSTYPIAELEGNLYDYGIMNNRLDEVYKLYRPFVVYDSSKELLCAVFSVMPFDDDNDLVLTVRDPAVSLRSNSNVVHTIDINRYMSDNDISVEGKNEATISMMLEFNGLEIKATLPEWENETIDPSI